MEEDNKYSIASRKRMKAIPKLKRVANAKIAGQARQKSMTVQERKIHARNMVKAREKKRHGQA